MILDDLIEELKREESNFDDETKFDLKSNSESIMSPFHIDTNKFGTSNEYI